MGFYGDPWGLHQKQSGIYQLHSCYLNTPLPNWIAHAYMIYHDFFFHSWGMTSMFYSFVQLQVPDGTSTFRHFARLVPKGWWSINFVGNLIMVPSYYGWTCRTFESTCQFSWNVFIGKAWFFAMWHLFSDLLQLAPAMFSGILRRLMDPSKHSEPIVCQGMFQDFLTRGWAHS